MRGNDDVFQPITFTADNKKIKTTAFTDYPDKAGAWYDMSGRKIGDSSSVTRHSSLPRGVYIHNGKKVVIK